MDRIAMNENGGNYQPVADPIHFARSYQLEALEKALTQNTVVFFETGTGKTLISIMLLRSYAPVLRKPSPNIAVFLVPTVVLVHQQAVVVETHTDLRVGKYYGEMGVDFWNEGTWKYEKDKHEVFVMTSQILLDALRRKFLLFEHIKVLIFDECHNARGKHPYALIMKEFYHRHLGQNIALLPRIFGMTASPIKAKGSNTERDYWKQINELEMLMHSKVFTCESVSELSKYITFSTPKLKMYNHINIPELTSQHLENRLIQLMEKHKNSLISSTISVSTAKSVKKKLDYLLNNFMFCLNQLGVWLAMEAAKACSHAEQDIFEWDRMDASGERVIRSFSTDAAKVLSSSMPTSGQEWSIANDIEANMTTGYLSSKITCLVETLLEYREIKDLRCIVFVERIVTAIVISRLLNEMLRESPGWTVDYTAGYSSSLYTQSRKEQNAIVDQFRLGAVNIIVATAMLEEGLDVQSCNLVIRFDLSNTVCSFIQSRGRARCPNSDFVVMVESGDNSALSRVQTYIASVDIMRRESLKHADLPCQPLDNEMFDEPWYEVESTGAMVTLSASVQLIYFYCSRLPSDGYFKPYPHFKIDKDLGVCTLQFPNSSPIRSVTVEGNSKSLKQLACLEACKQLHKIGALTNNLVPDIVKEETEVQENGFESFQERPVYFPSELATSGGSETEKVCYLYLIELRRHYHYDVKPQDVVLAVNTRLDNDLESLVHDLDVDRGKLSVRLKYFSQVTLTSAQIAMCQKFQNVVFRFLLDHNVEKFPKDNLPDGNGRAVFDYLLLPSMKSHHHTTSIDWECINSVQYLNIALSSKHTAHCPGEGCGRSVLTKSGLVCSCMLENSLVRTPHTSVLYCVTGTMDGFDGNTYMELDNGETMTYIKFYKQKHGIDLLLPGQTLLKAKHIFTVHNYLQRCPQRTKETKNSSYELPPELCEIIMSPICVSTFYSFSFLPSIMHRIESLLIAHNLLRIHADQCTETVHIPTLSVLEAITAKQCLEKIHLESLETLGDSFLKYAATQHLFKKFQSQHEGLLTLRRTRIISNVALCKLGCERKIMGFIRDEPFEPKKWIIPGGNAEYELREELINSRKVYCWGSRTIKSKRIADVVEALIGAFLTAGGERAALSFMAWLGVGVDLVDSPYRREFSVNPESQVNVRCLQSLLNYSFKDPSLLVEALTHGSYMVPEIPHCYQRLEFLGDAVLDYMITLHLYEKYPGISPGMLTNLRSATVNNDCYALSALKYDLHKHILHLSPELHRQIGNAVQDLKRVETVSTFGHDSEITFPKVLGDVIESLAGAIYVDSGYDKKKVFESIRPLLEPLVTPEQLKPHPVAELTDLCTKEHYTLTKKKPVRDDKGVPCVSIQVEANGVTYEGWGSGANKKTAKKIASKEVLKKLKEGSK